MPRRDRGAPLRRSVRCVDSVARFCAGLSPRLWLAQQRTRLRPELDPALRTEPLSGSLDGTRRRQHDGHYSDALTDCTLAPARPAQRRFCPRGHPAHYSAVQQHAMLTLSRNHAARWGRGGGGHRKGASDECGTETRSRAQLSAPALHSPQRALCLIAADSSHPVCCPDQLLSLPPCSLVLSLEALTQQSDTPALTRRIGP